VSSGQENAGTGGDRRIFADALMARDAAQRIIAALGQGRGQTKLEIVEALGVDPKVYALTYIFLHAEKTLDQVAVDLGCTRKTLFNWRKEGIGRGKPGRERGIGG